LAIDEEKERRISSLYFANGERDEFLKEQLSELTLLSYPIACIAQIRGKYNVIGSQEI